MKNIKKILALALALVMVLGISSVALAADETGVLPDKDAVVASTDNTLNKVSFKVKYTRAAGVNVPQTTFSYTIAPIATAIAATSSKPAVKVPAAATLQVGTGTAAASVQVQFTANDADAYKTVDVNLPAFSTAGIYRYTVKQASISDAAKALGIAAADAANGQDEVTFYLDVYVKNVGTEAAPVYKATQAALKTTDEVMAADSTKVEGFTNKYAVKDPEHPNDPTNPDPLSYNVVISKAVKGVAADTEQLFDFTLNLTGPAAGTDVTVEGLKVTLTKADSTTHELTLKAGAAMDSGVTFQLKDAQSVTLSGVPVGVTVNVSEGASVYVPTAVVTGMTTNADATTLKAEANNALAVTDTVKIGENAGSIAYTNTLDDISMTGVALRVAPFVMILAAGCLMLVIGKRRKEAEEA